MRVLVCGGREFDDWWLLEKTLTDLLTNSEKPLYIIQGGAKGADFLARCWAKLNNVEHQEFPANWSKYGKAAGYKRNKQMLEEGKPDLIVAFKGGNGTRDMKRQAKKADVEVFEVFKG